MMNTNQLKLLLITLLIGVTQGCATMSSSDCLKADWKAIGFKDGSKGKAVSYIETHGESCAEHGVRPVVAKYKRGHAEGIRLYCAPRKAFKLGVRGKSHNNDCPADLRKAFVTAHKNGLQLRAAKADAKQAKKLSRSANLKMSDVTRKINRLQETLSAARMSSKKSVAMYLQFRETQTQSKELEIAAQIADQEAVNRQREYEYLKAKFRY